MITLKELKADLEWSMKEFLPIQVRDIHSAIDSESIRSLDELKFREDEGELEDGLVFYDKNLVAAIESCDLEESLLVDLINRHYGERVDLFYIEQDDMYAVIYYRG